MNKPWLAAITAACLPSLLSATCEYQPVLTATPVDAPSRPLHADLEVLTLNMAMVDKMEPVDLAMKNVADLKSADVLLLQEVIRGTDRAKSVPESLAARLGYHMAFAPSWNLPLGAQHGIAVLSRYPIADVQTIPLPQYDLHFRSRCRIALAATIQTPNGPVRVFNVHLDNRLNAPDRLKQLTPVLNAAKATVLPVLLGGDFNSSEIYWLGRMLPIPFGQSQSTAVLNAVLAEGFTTPFQNTGYTFKGLPLKLDWIFTRGLAPADKRIDTIPFSDHNALWARFRLPQAATMKR